VEVETMTREMREGRKKMGGICKDAKKDANGYDWNE